MRKEAINGAALANRPALGACAVRIDNVLHIAGLSAPTPAAHSSIEEQTRMTFDSIAAVLAEAGGQLSDVFGLTVRYTRAQDWAVVDRIVSEYLTEPGFIRTGYLTKLRYPGALIEIEATAMLNVG